MRWIVVVLACVAAVAVVVWFVFTRRHPETAASHLGRGILEDPRNQTGWVARQPAGPDAEAMSPDSHGVSGEGPSGVDPG